jgi:hypothetical protein
VKLLYTTDIKMSEHGIIEMMSDILGSTRQVVPVGNCNIVLTKLPDEDLAPKNSSYVEDTELSRSKSSPEPSDKSSDDYMFQMYLGSMTVVGLFILFRMIQKSR